MLDTQLITYEVDEAGSVIAINTVTDYTSTTPYEGYDLENFSKEFIGSIKYYYTFRHLYTIDANTMLFEIPEDLDDVKAYKITKGEKVLANNKTYYLGTETWNIGRMARGWEKIGDKYYYFNTDGLLVTNSTTPDGYKLDETGAWIV